MDQVDIPSEFVVPLIGITIDAHWELHALLMFAIWFVLVPVSILAMRYAKPKPRPYGVPDAAGYFFSRMHIRGLYTAITLTLLGGGLAVIVSGGFSGTLHSYFGVGTLIFGALQIVSAWTRGTHGGKYGHGSDPDDPSTWHGDHFDMTPRRVWFEAYHKTLGYFTLAMAAGAIITGLAQYWIGYMAVAAVLLFFVFAAICVVSEGLGIRYDTYRSVYGNHPDLPGNRKRSGL